MDFLSSARAGLAAAIAAAHGEYQAAPQPHLAWERYLEACAEAYARYDRTPLLGGRMQPVWLYYELSADGQVTSGDPGHQAIPIEDHLAEVPQGAFANDLLRQVVYHRTDAVGRLLPPAYAWRLATDAEVKALAAKRAALSEVTPGAKTLTETEGDGASTPADKSTAQTPAA